MPNSNTTETISVSLPGTLITRLDKTRKAKFMSRSAFIQYALRTAIGIVESEKPDFWEQSYQDTED